MKKICKTCKKELDISNFQKNGFYNNKQQKYKAHCIECSKIKYKEQSHFRIFKILKELNIPLECELCGYSKNLAALDFHHVDPAEKEFHIKTNSQRSELSLKREINKCVILCANCHREYHNEELCLTSLMEKYLASNQ